MAWQFDETYKKKIGDNKRKTLFLTEMFSTTVKMNAADFGNFNAGYTGTYAGIPQFMQLFGAGAAEMKKTKNWKELLIQISNPHAPYGDNPRDMAFNILGMYYAENKN